MDEVRRKREPARDQDQQGRSRAGKGSRDAGSGEGADSALANLRELERSRAECEPADDAAAEPDAPPPKRPAA